MDRQTLCSLDTLMQVNLSALPTKLPVPPSETIQFNSIQYIIRKFRCMHSNRQLKLTTVDINIPYNVVNKYAVVYTTSTKPTIDKITSKPSCLH